MAFQGRQLSTLVALATSRFILQKEFLLIIYSDSDSDSDYTIQYNKQFILCYYILQNYQSEAHYKSKPYNITSIYTLYTFVNKYVFNLSTCKDCWRGS